MHKFYPVWDSVCRDMLCIRTWRNFALENVWTDLHVKALKDRKWRRGLRLTAVKINTTKHTTILGHIAMLTYLGTHFYNVTVHILYLKKVFALAGAFYVWWVLSLSCNDALVTFTKEHERVHSIVTEQSTRVERTIAQLRVLLLFSKCTHAACKISHEKRSITKTFPSFLHCASQFSYLHVLWSRKQLLFQQVGFH